MNRIFFELQSTEFGPGDQINGFVHLELLQLYPANCIFIKIEGIEGTRLEKSYTVSTGHGKKKRRRKKYKIMSQQRDLVTKTIPVYQFVDYGIPPGMYKIPVSFILPSGLPSSFAYRFNGVRKKGLYANVKYQLVAFLPVPNGGLNGCPVITSSQPFTIRQNIKQMQESGPKSAEINKGITTCCCISKGNVKIKAYFEKNQYRIGETAYVIAEIDNSKCTAKIEQIKGALRRELTFKASNFSKNYSAELNMITFLGIEAGQTKLGKDASRVPIKINTQESMPSCSGQLVKSQYFLEVSLKMDACQCCASNPTVKLPINISNTSPPVMQLPQMANYNPQVMQAYTGGMEMAKDYSNPLDQMNPQIMPGQNGGQQGQTFFGNQSMATAADSDSDSD